MTRYVPYLTYALVPVLYFSEIPANNSKQPGQMLEVSLIVLYYSVHWA